jgi:hypothetical protein
VRALDLRSDVPLPRLWHLLFAVLVLGFALDQRMLWKTGHTLAKDPMPSEISEMADHESDLAIGRTKWLLYATIRTFLFALAFLYVGLIDRLCWLATTTSMGMAEGVQAKGMMLALAASFGLTLRRFWQFATNYVAFGKTVAKSSAFASRRAILRLVLDGLSLVNPVSRVGVARTSLRSAFPPFLRMRFCRQRSKRPMRVTRSARGTRSRRSRSSCCVPFRSVMAFPPPPRRCSSWPASICGPRGAWRASPQRTAFPGSRPMTARLIW